MNTVHQLRPLTHSERQVLELHAAGTPLGEISTRTGLNRVQVAAAIELADKFGTIPRPATTTTSAPVRAPVTGPHRIRRSSTTKKGPAMTAVLDTRPIEKFAGNPCPTPEKDSFKTITEALAAVAESDAKYGTDNTPYACNCGMFHNTTKAKPKHKLKTSSSRIDMLAATFEPAPLRPTTDLTVGFYILTPKTAAFWLKNFNTHNRNMRDRGTNAFALDIHTGGWDLNGDTIRFDTDGTLFDGQHRCSAIVASNTPVPIILVTGLDPIAQDTTDGNMRRTFADALKLAGYTDVNNVASVTAAVCRWKAGQIRGNTKTNLSIKVLWKVLRDNEPAILNAVKTARRTQGGVPIITSMAGLASFLFHEISPEDHDAFFDKLTTGADLAINDPIYKLRKKLQDDANSKQKLRKVEILAFFIKSWNAYRAGDTMDNLAWRSGGARPEAFPTPR